MQIPDFPKKNNKKDESIYDRLPPYSEEAEQSLIGSILISQEISADIIDKIDTFDFYREAHQIIYQNIKEMYLKGLPIDPVKTADYLDNKGILDKVGGKTYIHTLISIVPTAANAKYYAEIVEQKSILRSLIVAGTEIVQLGYEPADDPTNVADRAEDIIFKVTNKRISERFVLLKELLSPTFEKIAHLHEKKSPITGISTGYIELDDITSGFHPSNMIVIAARPSMGKTSLALGIAQNVGLREKKSVAIFSLEMSALEVAQRMICSEARIDARNLRTGKLREEDWSKISKAMGRLAEAPIFIDETPSINVMELRAKARRLKAKEDLNLIIVDYLQLMEGVNRNENRQQEISDISRSLKILARELNCPILAVSQLSRAVESRPNKRPYLSDLRESGAIEQDADVVIFIYRDEYYHSDTEDKGIAEIIIGKHRNGPTGDFRLAFLEHYTKFANLQKNI